jgi:hypothetical protein
MFARYAHGAQLAKIAFFCFLLLLLLILVTAAGWFFFSHTHVPSDLSGGGQRI